jgi:hypothetical protein
VKFANLRTSQVGSISNLFIIQQLTIGTAIALRKRVNRTASSRVRNLMGGKNAEELKPF